MTKVNLTYFKPSGKYYTSGSYFSEQSMAYNIYVEVEEWRRYFHKEDLPGLNVDSWEGYILVSPENNVPCLLDFCDHENFLR